MILSTLQRIKTQSRRAGETQRKPQNKFFFSAPQRLLRLCVKLFLDLWVIGWAGLRTPEGVLTRLPGGFHRRYVTLIEVVIALALLGMLAAGIGINVSRAMREQRFKSEVGMVVDQLRLAQNLMLIHGEDIKVHFKEMEGSVQYFLAFQCPNQHGWDKELTRVHTLKAIRMVSFKGEKDESRSGELTLNFLSGGMVMSQGILTLSTAMGYGSGDTRYIFLAGYPQPILAYDSQEKLIERQGKNRSNDSGLTQFMMPDLIAKYQAEQSPNATEGSQTSPPTTEESNPTTPKEETE